MRESAALISCRRKNLREKRNNQREKLKKGYPGLASHCSKRILVPLKKQAIRN